VKWASPSLSFCPYFISSHHSPFPTLENFLHTKLHTILISNRLHWSEGDSIAARWSPAGIPDQIQTDILPQSRLDPISGRSLHAPYVYEHYEVLHMQH
jgi:hypothetical protein